MKTQADDLVIGRLGFRPVEQRSVGWIEEDSTRRILRESSLNKIDMINQVRVNDARKPSKFHRLFSFLPDPARRWVSEFA